MDGAMFDVFRSLPPARQCAIIYSVLEEDRPADRPNTLYLLIAMLRDANAIDAEWEYISYELFEENINLWR